MLRTSRGQFVTIEGCEGVGKSTNIEFIADSLKKENIPYVLTREPGGTPLAEDIRNLFLSPRAEQVAENTELLLMFAARAQHIAEVIEPSLSAGTWVICDRFTDATYAYQGGGRGINPDKIASLEQWVQDDLRPDFTLLFDAPIETGMARVSKRGELDRMEQEHRLFFENVRNTYLELAAKHVKRYRVVDASQNLQDVQCALSVIISEIIACAS